jgi:hypothetical protein
MDAICPTCGMMMVRGRCVFPMCASHVSQIGTLQITGPKGSCWLRGDRIESVMFVRDVGVTIIRTFGGDTLEQPGDCAETLVRQLGWHMARADKQGV